MAHYVVLSSSFIYRFELNAIPEVKWFKCVCVFSVRVICLDENRLNESSLD